MPRYLGTFVIGSILFSGGDALAAVTRPAPIPTNLGIGVNIVDLGTDFVEPTYQSPAEDAVRLRMGKKAVADAYHVIGANHVAILMPGYHPANAEDLKVGHNDLSLWQKSPQTYWPRVDAMLHEVSQYGMKVVIRGWNDLQTFPTLEGETTHDLVTNPNSKSWALYREYWGQFLTRYKGNSAIALYEGPLEMNGQADLNAVAACKSEYNGMPDESLECSTVGNYSTSEMIAFSKRVVAFFKHVNPAVKIASNMSFPAPSAYHLSLSPQWSPNPNYGIDTKAQFIQDLAEIDAPYDYVDVHVYNGTAGNSVLRFGYGGNSPTSAALLQLIGQAAAQIDKHVYLGEFGDEYGPDIAHQYFTEDVISEIPRSNVIGGAMWALEYFQFDTYQYQAIGNGYTFDYDAETYPQLWNYVRSMNERFGHPVYAPFTPLAPDVIISFPFTGTTVANGSILNVLASAASGTITRVDVLVDGKPYKTLSKWPFMTTLSAPAGTHHVVAAAYDTAGEGNSDSIDVTIK